jgi:hypothetical protein
MSRMMIRTAVDNAFVCAQGANVLAKWLSPLSRSGGGGGSRRHFHRRTYYPGLSSPRCLSNRIKSRPLHEVAPIQFYTRQREASESAIDLISITYIFKKQHTQCYSNPLNMFENKGG